MYNMRHDIILLTLDVVFISYKDVVVNFNPQLVVIDAGDNTTLVRDFLLTYSISSGDPLTINGSLGSATIDEPIQNIVVSSSDIQELFIAYLMR